ncbi:MAG: diaminopimelate epimerase [Verrucomicrobia bacterium]|nr:diaminopimelate epimerase [Verrucomicrobiota bacterium]
MKTSALQPSNPEELNLEIVESREFSRTSKSNSSNYLVVKYSGAGNRFLCIDDRQGQWQLTPAAIQSMCQRGNCDGILVAKSSCIADIAMQIFNLDGGAALMCGNGLRCFKRFLATLGLRSPLYSVETGAGLRKVWEVGDLVAAEMGQPRYLLEKVQLNEEITIDLIDTGVPHAIVFVDDIEKAPLATFGPYIRHHPLFSPGGTNVTFVQMETPSTLSIRTFERGVEGETLACGTGACAAAVAAAKELSLDRFEMEVLVRSGQSLHISFDNQELVMTGPALPC